jgi:hypothetical protein
MEPLSDVFSAYCSELMNKIMMASFLAEELKSKNCNIISGGDDKCSEVTKIRMDLILDFEE